MSDYYKRTSPVTGKTVEPMAEPRFLELATFMRTPFAETLEGLDIGLLGVPMDIGVTNRPGTRHGPREIRNQSSNVRKIHPFTRVNPFEGTVNLSWSKRDVAPSKVAGWDSAGTRHLVPHTEGASS